MFQRNKNTHAGTSQVAAPKTAPRPFDAARLDNEKIATWHTTATRVQASFFTRAVPYSMLRHPACHTTNAREKEKGSTPTPSPECPSKCDKTHEAVGRQPSSKALPFNALRHSKTRRSSSASCVFVPCFSLSTCLPRLRGFLPLHCTVNWYGARKRCGRGGERGERRKVSLPFNALKRQHSRQSKTRQSPSASCVFAPCFSL